MSTDEIQFSPWMPPDARQTWTHLFSGVRSSDEGLPAGNRADIRVEARYVLQRLATRLEMKDAWVELRRFPNCSPGHLVMMTYATWLCAFRNRLLAIAPHYADSSERTFAIESRAVANRMRAVDPTIRAAEGITDTTLAELDHVAAYFERNAETWDTLSKIAWPPRKARAKNALQIAFVNAICNFLWRESKRRPYTLVAILANVVFDVPEDELWDVDRVKKCYASGSRK
jgi:hypothetical protein